MHGIVHDPTDLPTGVATAETSGNAIVTGRDSGAAGQALLPSPRGKMTSGRRGVGSTWMCAPAGAPIRTHYRAVSVATAGSLVSAGTSTTTIWATPLLITAM